MRRESLPEAKSSRGSPIVCRPFTKSATLPQVMAKLLQGGGFSWVGGNLEHEQRERSRNTRERFASFVPFRVFRDPNVPPLIICPETLDPALMVTPRPTPLLWEGPSIVMRFDKFPIVTIMIHTIYGGLTAARLGLCFQRRRRKICLLSFFFNHAVRPGRRAGSSGGNEAGTRKGGELPSTIKAAVDAG